MTSAVRFQGKFSDERGENKAERGSVDGGWGRTYKSSRDELHLHSNMTLLLFRTAALPLLMAAAVASQRGITCREEIPAGLIRDLWSRTTELIDRLPKEDKVPTRLLPKFCTGCSKHVIGWRELQALMDVYQNGVFSHHAVQKILPLHYNELLYRLQQTLHHCVSASEPSKLLKLIKKVERKIKKRKAKSHLKAVREFIFILRWMDELTQNL
ncbi:uncharacterized protein LOC130519459 [Takifugu flavidus]|uniref:uncharacterized protein LOC130519459 n=1 Tax=Takifugu flavidus TaxID=433684 RepID=UPI0025446714|nr:uncharacterized protein LOC130519459 [Takifugu flavidus]